MKTRAALILWSLLYNLTAAIRQAPWNATTPFTSGGPNGTTSVFNITSGFQYVDPLIGTAAGGHVFPGATMPFGMAKPVADVMGENQGGFSADGGLLQGFSHMHDSGE